MRRTLYLLLFLVPAMAQTQPLPPIPFPPVPTPPPPTNGGLIGLLCTFFGDIKIQIEDWQINFCELNKFFESYNKNTRLFLDAQSHLIQNLDRPLVQTSWYLNVLNEGLSSLGRAPLPDPPPAKSPAAIYDEALKKEEITIQKAEENALEALGDYYGDLFSQLKWVADQYERQVSNYLAALKQRENNIKSLQKRLEKTLPGTEEAQTLINLIHRNEQDITRITRRALDYVYREAPRLDAARQMAKQALTDLDRITTDIKSQTNRLAAAKAAKRVAEEQTERFVNLIEETNEKVNALVREAQNATSTRAAVQILTKGLGQLTQTTVVTQSLLHAALSELAQQNVYTNQQIAQTANILAKQAANEFMARSDEIQAEISMNVGKMRTLVDHAETLARAKELIFDNPCVTTWHLGCSTDGKPTVPLIPPPW